MILLLDLESVEKEDHSPPAPDRLFGVVVEEPAESLVSSFDLFPQWLKVEHRLFSSLDRLSR